VASITASRNSHVRLLKLLLDVPEDENVRSDVLIDGAASFAAILPGFDDNVDILNNIVLSAW